MYSIMRLRIRILTPHLLYLKKTFTIHTIFFSYLIKKKLISRHSQNQLRRSSKRIFLKLNGPKKLTQKTELGKRKEKRGNLYKKREGTFFPLKNILMKQRFIATELCSC